MEINDKLQFEISNLVIKAFDQAISQEEFDHLQYLLKTDPSAPEFYYDLISTYSCLDEIKELDLVVGENNFDNILAELANHEKVAPVIQISKADKESERELIQKVIYPSREKRKISKFNIVSLVMSAAAILFLALFIHFSPVPKQRLVGRLTRTADAEWINATGAVKEGSDLYSGPLYLKKGLAEIVLDNGAEMIVQGPCDFILENESQVFLNVGSIVANIENMPDKRFVVRTSNATIVDYGTEFGVTVDQGGSTRSHVFKGSVEIRKGSDPLKYEKALRLNSNEGGQVNRQGRLSRAKLSPHRFARKDHLETAVLASEGSTYHRWKASHYKLHRDPNLMAHYTFEKANRYPDQLKNQAPETQDQLDGILEGEESKPQWAQGRWAQKTALFFDRSQNQRVRIPADSRLCTTDPITLGAWIKMERAPEGFVPVMYGGNILTNGINGKKCNYHLSYGLYYEGHMMIYMRHKGYDFHTIGPMIDLPANQWHFLAVTHDNDMVRFYINGKLMKTVEKSITADPVSADLLIGGMEPDQHIYRFHGFIDEVLILNRVLSEAQMQVLYETGKP